MVVSKPTPERRSSELAEIDTAVSIHQESSLNDGDLTVAQRRGESITGYRPQSSQAAVDGSCSDIMNNVQMRVRRIMEQMQDMSDDADDLFQSVWSECQLSGTAGRQTGKRIAGPRDPVRMHDGTSMCGRPSTTAAVKHTRYHSLHGSAELL